MKIMLIDKVLVYCGDTGVVMYARERGPLNRVSWSVCPVHLVCNCKVKHTYMTTNILTRHGRMFLGLFLMEVVPDLALMGWRYLEPSLNMYF